MVVEKRLGSNCHFKKSDSFLEFWHIPICLALLRHQIIKMSEILPITEQENPKTLEIDRVSTLEAIQLINVEDKTVAFAVEKVLPQIAEAIDRIVEGLKNGGRLFYVGTGTSGRLGVLDASEIPPTFGVSPDLIQGVISGGWEALYKASEASEDDRDAGAEDLIKRGVTGADAVIGIAASGRTPYTIGALDYACSLGCFTACITCSTNSPITQTAEISIVPKVGPEAITGSTRMKAATAQKMVLNMISTVAMIRLGYVRGNRMTNVKPTNVKLRERSLRILAAETGLTPAAAAKLLDEAGGDLRVALVMADASVNREAAESALRDANFVVEKAIEYFR